MGKGMPWEKFWYENFMGDLKPCSCETRGFWISFLAYLWDQNNGGKITCTIDEAARLTSTTVDEAKRSLEQIERFNVADVERQKNAEGTELFTITNRRLERDKKSRELYRLRKQRFVDSHRENEKGTPEEREKERKRNAQEDKKIRREEEIKASFNNQGGENDGSFKEKTQAALNKVLLKFPRFPHARLLGNAFALNQHPEAIIYSLEETASKCKLDPALYFETILKRTSGNFYEKEHVAASEKFKIEPGQVGNILKNLSAKKGDKDDA